MDKNEKDFFYWYNWLNTMFVDITEILSIYLALRYSWIYPILFKLIWNIDTFFDSDYYESIYYKNKKTIIKAKLIDFFWHSIKRLPLIFTAVCILSGHFIIIPIYAVKQIFDVKIVGKYDDLKLDLYAGIFDLIYIILIYLITRS